MYQKLKLMRIGQTEAYGFSRTNLSHPLLLVYPSLSSKKQMKTSSHRNSTLPLFVLEHIPGPMLIDTANFSKEAGKATPLDQEMMAKLELRINSSRVADSSSNGRNELYRALQNAKSDVSQLTADDLLIKDLKVVNGIPIPGLPILVKVS